MSSGKAKVFKKQDADKAIAQPESNKPDEDQAIAQSELSNNLTAELKRMFNVFTFRFNKIKRPIDYSSPNCVRPLML